MNPVPHNLESALRARSQWLLVLTIALAGVGFLLTEHDLLKSAQEEYGTTADVLETRAGEARWKNAVGFSLVGLLGIGLLASRSQRRFRGGDLGAIALLGFLAWCAASIAWSIDLALTGKRVAILLLCFVAALGVARHLSARDLCRLMAIATGTYVALGVCAELALGTFKPWTANYRFAGTMHPNGQAENCACLCLAAFFWARSARRGRQWLWALLAAGLAALLLTKSRTSCVALAAGLLASFVVRTSWPRIVMSGLIVVCMACVLLLAAHILGVERDLPALLALGRAEHVETLSGRTELWPELLWYSQSRPWAGFGYGAFWTADHVADISGRLYWGISSAHSGYLEMLLNVGVIGVALLAVAAMTALWRAGSSARHGDDAGSSFVFALFIVSAVVSMAEAGFAAPSFMTWVTGCALTQLTCFLPAPSGLPAASPAGPRLLPAHAT